MNLRVNDKDLEIREDATVLELLAQLGLAEQRVAVELNLEIVPRARHGEARLGDGDRLEIVTLVGGG
jgi:thiamine biosynthesis protein ThiS